MKKISVLATLLTVMACAVSCDKNIDNSQPQLSERYRQVTIKAGSARTRTSVSGGNLTWSKNDKLNIVPQTGSAAAVALDIQTGVGEASGTFQGQVDSTIKDNTSLYGWCGGDWAYSSGSFSVNMPSTQTYVENGLAENAYPSIGSGTDTSGISLSNPMGILKLTVKGATTTLVKSVSVTSVSNNLAGAFAVDPGSSYAVSGGSSKTLTISAASPYVALSSTGVNFYIVVPPAEYAANDLTAKITFSNDEYLNNTFTDAVTVTANNATAKEISISSDDKTGTRGTLNGQEYVLIKARYNGSSYSYLKWATQNLAVTESGKGKWNGTDYAIGDYFQWAASYAGYGITADADKVFANLVIYDSFVNTFTQNGNSFTFKSNKKFNSASSPYISGVGSYSKYNLTDAGKVLESSDDVANIVLGSTWRMPTGGSSGEFAKMCEVTYWAWDDMDKGYYVFKPGFGTDGKAKGVGSIAGTDDKKKALLFFPATGYGSGETLDAAAIVGNYFSGTLENLYSPYAWDFNSSEYWDSSNSRDIGYPVRPVSK